MAIGLARDALRELREVNQHLEQFHGGGSGNGNGNGSRPNGSMTVNGNDPYAAPSVAPADRSIFDSAHDAFVAMDADGLITAWNPAAESTFGWTRDEAIGRLVSQTIIPPHVSARPTRRA